MKIGNLQLENNIFLAPMAGVTDKAFRLITKPFGPALMYTEMVSGKGLHYKSKKTAELLTADDEEYPIAVQIFGHEPDIMAEIASDALSYGAVMIDINMGCPAPKIVKNGDGSALMKNPELAGDIVKAVCSSVNVPVSVKIRSGWDDNCINAVEMAKTVEANGASAITVHGRTREQFYSGTANWNIIKDVKNAVTIPVIGNGDINSGRRAKEMLDYTGCDGIMVGRAAEGCPWIFRDIIHFLKTGEDASPINIKERVDVAIKHFDLLLELKGERRGVLEGRKHMAWYFKGVKGGAMLRESVNKAENPQKMRDILMKFYDEYLMRGGIDND